MYIFHSGVEDAFYNLKLRLNGKKLTKKSIMVSLAPSSGIIRNNFPQKYLRLAEQIMDVIPLLN